MPKKRNRNAEEENAAAILGRPTTQQILDMESAQEAARDKARAKRNAAAAKRKK